MSSRPPFCIQNGELKICLKENKGLSDIIKSDNVIVVSIKCSLVIILFKSFYISLQCTSVSKYFLVYLIMLNIITLLGAIFIVISKLK